MFGEDYGGAPVQNAGPSAGLLFFMGFLVIAILIGMYIFLTEGTWRGTLNKSITGGLDAIGRDGAKK